MWLARVFVIFVSLTAIKGAEKESKKKSQLNQKRATDPYSYPLPEVRFNEDSKAGGTKTKVIVETIKSISPPEYLPPAGYANSPIDSNTANLQAPAQGGSVSYNAYEPDAEKKSTILTSPSTVTSAPVKKKSGGLQSYKYYGGASAATSISTSQPSSTISPAPVRTTSVEPATTLPPGYQYTSRVAGGSQSTSTPEKSVKIGGVKPNKGYSYSPSKIVKKPTRLEPKLADSKPEETGFNGYHYEVGNGGLSYEAPTKHTGPQPGMMGLSFMRSSSPYYNYHVMLD